MSQHNANDKIAQRAYELYLSRGGEHGNDLNDWLQAEKEVLTTQSDSNKTARASKPASRQKSARKR